MRDDFRELNGLRHHLLVRDAAPGAPTLVLLHGFLDLAWSFAPFAEALGRLASLRIVALDFRGHGESERVGRGGYYHFADYVADVHALVTSFDRPHLLGHSMGGSVAALVAGAFPRVVDRLVLVEGLGPPADRTEEPPDRMARWIDEVNARRGRPLKPMPSREDAARRLREANPRLSPELAALLAEKGTRAVDGGHVWAYDPLHRTRSPAPFAVADFRSFLRRIEAPTLLVEGRESAFRAWIGDDREKDLADREHAAIEDAGHMVHQDRPEALAAEVARFLFAAR